MEKELKKKILKVVSASDLRKGENYRQRYINYIERKNIPNNGSIFRFMVESERTYQLYNVLIAKYSDEEINTNCNCLQFVNFGTCKHVAACLYHYSDEIFHFVDASNIRAKSLEILNSFKQDDINSKNGTAKKELKLEVEFEFSYGRELHLRLKVGENQTYVLKNKMEDFFDALYSGKGIVCFGKNFTYDPTIYYFNKTDMEILDYVYDIVNTEYGIYYPMLEQSNFLEKNRQEIFNLLKDKDFTIKRYGIVHGFKNENPFKPVIFKEKDEYVFDLNIINDDAIVISNNYKYIVTNHVGYYVTNKFSTLLKKMAEANLGQLVFSEKDLTTFTNGIVPIVREDIIVDETVTNLIIPKKPTCKLYFDIYCNDVLCNIKFVYGDKEIDYLDKVDNIVRDIEEENKVVNDVMEIGFILLDKFVLDDVDKQGEFFEKNLEKIALKYDTYTSEKIKETNIVKTSNIKSEFSIGSDNIMNFSFDLGEINARELEDLFDSLKRKKKYYKLKSGSLINLETDNELRQLENLIDDLNLDNKALINGQGEIPKYRAIYLDSLKKDKYNIIKTNNLFDEFIDNFNNFKNNKVKFSKREKEILRDYQEIGIEWLYNIYKCDLGAILADEMGLGKSIQIIYLFKKLLKEDKTSRFLIVSPTSLVYNWEEEFKKFAPEIKYEILSSGKDKRHENIINSKASVYITSYGILREDLELYQDINFSVCVIDEAQNIKNPNAGITQAVKKIKAHTKIALTGTPIENSVIELWSIFDFIMPGFFFSQQKFQKKYKVKVFDEDSNKLLAKLNRQISPFILRRKKEDVLKDLPDKISNNIYIDLTQEQKKLYAAEVKRVRREMDDLIGREGFTKARFMILQLLTKLRQLCIDPRIVYDDYKGESAKIDNLIKIVKELIENGHKILLFSSFRSSFEIIEKEFSKNNISYYEINGSVTSKKRMDLVNKFNQDNTNVFLITLKAGGTGLNLTSADTVIHLDLWWNPQAENQATDRAHRIGQKNTVSIIKLVARGTIEERILELQEKKKTLSNKIIDGDASGDNMLSNLTEKDFKNLLSYEQE